MIDYSSRLTPYNITSLQLNEVFVYGDNEAHRHGKGAAKTAMRWGAEYGKGGLVGQTYGIPTVNASITYKLPLSTIQKYIDRFLADATLYKNKIFLVTEIGCGLAGYQVTDIAPLFKAAQYISNIYLPITFWKVIETLGEENEE